MCVCVLMDVRAGERYSGNVSCMRESCMCVCCMCVCVLAV